jgi:hypothetical protein
LMNRLMKHHLVLAWSSVMLGVLMLGWLIFAALCAAVFALGVGAED